MEGIYRRVFEKVVKEFISKGELPGELAKVALSYEADFVRDLSAHPIKLKTMPVEKKEKAIKVERKCIYKNVSAKGEMKPCTGAVKDPYSMYCTKHLSMEARSNPEIFLRARFGDLFDKKCVNVTDDLRARDDVHEHIKSPHSHYFVYIIREIVEQCDGVYYANLEKEVGWEHALAGVIDEHHQLQSLSSAVDAACNALHIRPISSSVSAELGASLAKVTMLDIKH